MNQRYNNHIDNNIIIDINMNTDINVHIDINNDVDMYMNIGVDTYIAPIPVRPHPQVCVRHCHCPMPGTCGILLELPASLKKEQ